MSKYQPDTIMKDFLRKTTNYIDTVNGVLFKGKQLITSAVELDSEEGTTTEDGSVQRRRDLIKLATIDGEEVIIGIENQQVQDKTMTYRDMEYTILKYGIRLKDKDNDAVGIVTIVMYYGCRPWQCQRELDKIVKIPDKMKEYFNNWKTIIIDAKEVDYEVFQTKEVRDFFEGLQSLYSWDKDINHLKDLKLTYDTALALGVVTGTEPLIKKAEEMKGGIIHMCQAVDEALYEREMKGFQKGEVQGKYIGFQEGEIRAIEKIMKRLNVDETEAMDILDIPQNKRPLYHMQLAQYIA